MPKQSEPFEVEFENNSDGSFTIKTTGFDDGEQFTMEMFLLQALKNAKDTLELNRELEQANDDDDDDEDDEEEERDVNTGLDLKTARKKHA